MRPHQRVALKYAGLIKPPAKMTRDVYRYALSQVALRIIRECDKYIASAPPKQPRVIERENQALDFLSALDKSGARDLNNMYKDIRGFLNRFFPRDLPKLLAKDYGPVGSAKREDVKELLTPQIEKALEYMNRDTDIGGRSEWESAKKQLEKLVISSKIENGRSFPVELEDDWYLDEWGSSEIEVVVQEKDGGTASGAWSPHFRTLYVYVGLPRHSNDYPKVKDLKKKVYETVVHEMSHFAQTLISSVKRTDAGLPSKRIRTPEYSQHEGERGQYGLFNENHQLDDVEFYTNLRDAIRDVMRSVNAAPTEMKLDVFKSSVGERTRRSMSSTNLFFDTLKKKAPGKWRKAVGEAYKMIFN